MEDTDSTGHTPLMYAAKANAGPVVSALLARHARVDAQDEDGATALILALSTGTVREELVRLLVNAGLPAGDADGGGLDGAPHRVPIRSHPGAGDPPPRRRAAMRTIAPRRGQAPSCSPSCPDANDVVVSMLLAAGARVNEKTPDGWTPLMVAARSNAGPSVLRSC